MRAQEWVYSQARIEERLSDPSQSLGPGQLEVGRRKRQQACPPGFLNLLQDSPVTTQAEEELSGDAGPEAWLC